MTALMEDLADGGSDEVFHGWMPISSLLDRARCLGLPPDFFFPERGEDTSEPKAVCKTCSIRPHCFVGAIMRYEKYGVWGGASERQRRRIKKAIPDIDTWSPEMIDELLMAIDGQRPGRGAFDYLGVILDGVDEDGEDEVDGEDNDV